MKIGIFGGTFNPPHRGHVQLLESLEKRVGLDRIIVVPTYQNPLKRNTNEIGAEHRFQMAELAFGGRYEVRDSEIKKEKKSYTVETLQEIARENPAAELYLLMGADTLIDFDRWLHPQRILELANIVVTSRPGFDSGEVFENLPETISREITTREMNRLELRTGKTFQLVSIPEVDVSSTQIRRVVRANKKPQDDLPLAVENYIFTNELYQRKKDKTIDYAKLTAFCVEQLSEKKAIDVKGYDLREASSPSDYSIITSGTSTRATTALGESLARAVKDKFRINPQSTEGVGEGRWVLIDYGNLIVHIFYDFIRREYELEKLWSSGKIIH